MEQNFRHEYKFLISATGAEILRHRLRTVLQPDSHAGPTGQYTIRSLYFDDFAASAFYDKVSGVDNRTKYRSRCYDYQDKILRLEKKEKKGHLTRKTGQTITKADALCLQQHPGTRCPDHGMGLAEELRLWCATRGGRPAVLVDYDRTPFVCADGNTRITLDENLRTIPHCGELFAPAHPMVPVLEPGQVILEVKFDDFLPGHLSAYLADVPKVPMAISKFAMCMNLLF